VNLGMSLAMLQISDSAFPSGALSFSSGLERLVADGIVTDEEDLFNVMCGFLTHKWNTFDRVFMLRSLELTDSVQRARLDSDVEISTLSDADRISSRRAGRALLGSWARIGAAECDDYRKTVNESPTLGHLCVVQGLVYQCSGLTKEAAELVSSWSVISGMTSAAVRLDLVGYLSAQKILTRIRPLLVSLLAQSPATHQTPHAWSPLVDIAMMRHHYSDSRQFAS
jgi:urease accessory protein